MNPPLYFIVNYRAGAGRTARLWPRLRERIESSGIEHRVRTTDRPGDAARIAAGVPEGWTAVVVGGDTTLREAVAGLDPKRALAVIPTGGSNDFARTAGISPFPFIAWKQLLDGEVRAVDLPYANKTPFLNVAGIGFDLHPGTGGTSSPLRRPSYALSVLRALTQNPSARLQIEIDGESAEGNVFMMAVGNCRTMAGGMKVCPHAYVDDGLFDVCVAEALTRAETFAALARLFRGTHVRQRKFHYVKAHTIRVTGDSDLAVRADGQVIGKLPVTFTLRQKALNVVVPKGAWRPSKVTSIHSRQVDDGRCEKTH